MTTKDYLKVTIPFMLSTATQPLLGAANTAMMGRMPTADYIAAVALSVIFFNNVYWLFGFLRVATTSFSAQSVGTKRLVDRVVAMHPSDDVLALMKVYSDIAIIGAPLVFLNYVVLGWLMGQMLIKKVMFMQISMNVLNIALSFVTVFIMGMDVDGVAWSMVIAQGYGLMAGIWAVVKSRRFYLHDKFMAEVKNFSAFGKILRIQRDLMIRTACLLFINNLFTEAGTSLGIEVLAANAVLLELVFIISFFLDGMANGVSVFAGKAWGADNLELLENTIAVGMRCMWIFAIISAFICFAGGSFFLQFMTNQAEILALAREYVIYPAIHPLTAGAGLLLYGVYTATSYTVYIRNMMLVAALVFFACQQCFLPIWGNHGLWMAYIVVYGFESMACFYGIGMLKNRKLKQCCSSSTKF